MVEEILRSFTMNMRYARNLLADIPDEAMTRQPVAGMNHPAWIVGHLVHSFQAIGGEMGVTPRLPADWAERFGTGSRISSERSRYPVKDQIIASLEDASNRLSERLKRMTDQDLNEPLPDERFRQIFPTLGSAVLHILTCHTSVHLGQLSAWRRAMQMTPVEDPL